MLKKTRLLKLCILCLLFLVIPFFKAAAQVLNSNTISLSAKAGLDGYCKDGQWLPVRASLENHGPEIKGHLEVQLPGLNNGPVTYAREISLPSNSRKELFLYVYPEGYFHQVTLRLVDGGKELARTDLSITCASVNDRLYGLLAGNLASLNQLSELDPPDGKAYTAQLVPLDLPDRSQGLSSLDAIVIAAVDTSQLTLAQIQALSGWVASGGKMVVAGGPSWQGTVAGLVDLEDFLPFQPSGAQSLEGPEAGTSPAGTSASVENLPAGLVVTTGKLAEGSEVVIDQFGIPIVIRKTYGQGEVIYLAFDPTSGPVRAWGGLTKSLRAILGEPTRAHGFLDWVQASEAAGVITGMGIPSAGWLVAFLGAYVLVLGPANYWLLKRYRRRELAWLTIPLLVIIFSLLAFLVGRGLRGNRPILNRLAVVQTWPGTAQAQVDGLVGLFSPLRATYQLEINPSFLVHALPGGPMTNPNNTPAFLQTETGGTSIPAIRTDIGEVRSLALEGTLPSQGFSSELTLQITQQGAVLRGRLKLPVEQELQDAVLIAPGKSQSLGTLKAGESREVGLGLNQNKTAGFTPGSIPGVPPTYASLPINELLGSQDYYRDPQTRQRYLLLAAFFGQGQEPVTTLSPFILAGWSKDSPLASNLPDVVPETHDATLYLVRLDPKVEIASGRLTLPPGLFTWTPLEQGTYGGNSPYNTVVPYEGLRLSFQPAIPLPYKTVDGLTLQLKGYGASGKSGINVSLWNFQDGRWVLFPDLDWGKTRVASPQTYVGPGGEVRMGLDSSNQVSPVQIESADFILEVQG